MNKRRKVIHGIKLTICEACGASFRVKKFNKPYIGMFKGKPVFHWYYACSNCGYKHTVKFYNDCANPYFDKLINIDLSMIMYRNDEEKLKQLKVEYDNAKSELDKVYKEIIKNLNLKENYNDIFI